MESRCLILLFDEKFIDPETDEEVSLEDVLNNDTELGEVTGSRRHAWEQFLAAHDRD
jgi:hypothetical protein